MRWRPNKETHQQTYPLRGRFPEVTRALRRSMPSLEFGLLTIFPTRSTFTPPLARTPRMPIWNPQPLPRRRHYQAETVLRSQPFYYARHPSGLPDSFPLRTKEPRR